MAVCYRRVRRSDALVRPARRRTTPSRADVAVSSDKPATRCRRARAPRGRRFHGAVCGAAPASGQRAAPDPPPRRASGHGRVLLRSLRRLRHVASARVSTLPARHVATPSRLRRCACLAVTQKARRGAACANARPAGAALASAHALARAGTVCDAMSTRERTSHVVPTRSSASLECRAWARRAAASPVAYRGRALGWVLTRPYQAGARRLALRRGRGAPPGGAACRKVACAWVSRPRAASCRPSTTRSRTGRRGAVHRPASSPVGSLRSARRSSRQALAGVASACFAASRRDAGFVCLCCSARAAVVHVAARRASARLRWQRRAAGARRPSGRVATRRWAARSAPPACLSGRLGVLPRCPCGALRLADGCYGAAPP